MELDHVLIAVTNLATAAREIEARYGLASIEGGRHEGWGTANRIVPLGEAYLELVTVVDEAEAAQSPFGRWVARANPTLAQPLGWAVRTHELDEVGRRLDLTVAAGSRAARSGRLLRWRLAGIEQAAAEPSFPFFSSGGSERHFRAGPRQPIGPEPCRSQSCSSKATPIASQPGSVLTNSPSPCGPGRPRSRASSSPDLKARSP